MISKTIKLKNVGSVHLVYVCNLDAARHDFGWQPSVDPVAGVARTVDWLRENRAVFPSAEGAASAAI